MGVIVGQRAATSQRPGHAGTAFLVEGGDALGAVRRRRPWPPSSCVLDLAVRRPGRRRSPSRIAALGVAQPDRRVGGDRRRRARAPGRGRCRPATTSSTHPERAGLARRHSRRAVKIIRGRPRPADPAGEQLRAAAAGDDADADLGQARRRRPRRRRRGRRTARSRSRRRARSRRPPRSPGTGRSRTPPVRRPRHRPLGAQVVVGEAVALLEVGADAERLRVGSR